jgi:hypothetical protein
MLIDIETVEQVIIPEGMLIYDMMDNSPVDQELTQVDGFFPRTVLRLHQPVNSL